METRQRVLACVDQSHFADYVADYAAWAARRMEAALEFLHVINRHTETAYNSSDHSGAIGIDAQAQLLASLSTDDEARSRAAREHGRLFLNRLRERAISAGVPDPDTRQRIGDLEETLTAQQNSTDLFVLGRRGRAAEATQRDLGRNVERVVRALRKPILAVTEGFDEPHSAILAFDGGSVTRRGVEMLADSLLLRGIPLHLLMSGKLRNDAQQQMDWALTTLQQAGYEASGDLIPGDAEAIIGRQISDRGTNLLIMGAYGHSPLRTLFFGSKTSDLLRSSKVPALLLR